MTPVVEVRGLRKVYPLEGSAGVVALNAVDLTIAPGEFVAVMGPSGSGKSTFMHIVGLLDRPTAGTYLFAGDDVSHLSSDALADLRSRALGFVFQAYNLLPRTTALENVELPMFYSKPLIALRATRQRATQALENVGLGDRRHHHPNQLSGGQQQRIAIARALVNSPELLLADEPTGNLDTRTSIEIMGIFQKLNDAGITILMVTHELDIAAYCKRIIVMRDGQLISDTRNENRRLAQEQRAALDQAEQKAKLA